MNFDFVKKFQCHFYFSKLNNAFFYMSFEVFFVIIYKKKVWRYLDREIVGLNDPLTLILQNLSYERQEKTV